VRRNTISHTKRLSPSRGSCAIARMAVAASNPWRIITMLNGRELLGRVVSIGFLCLIVSAAIGTKARADLFKPQVVMDTNLLFIGSVDWQGPLTPDQILFKPAAVDPLIPADVVTTNWVVTIKQGNFDLVGPRVANDIQVSAIHQVPPPGPPHGEGVGGASTGIRLLGRE
jgi:hypothetical protein